MLGRCLLVACLLLVPFADASQGSSAGASSSVTPGEVETQLYFHLINIQDFPINTQLPQEDWREVVTYGSGTQTLTCAAGPLSGTPVSNFAGMQNPYHTYRGYSSPSFVEYDFVENGVPRTHSERLLGANITLNGEKDAAIHWFMLTSSQVPTAGQVLDPTAPPVVPRVVVQAVVRSPDSILMDDRAYDQGEVVLLGRTEAVTLVAGQALREDGQQSSQVRGEHTADGYLYEFVVPLDILGTGFDKHKGYVLRLDVFADVPACSDPQAEGTVMPNLVTAFTDALHRPRMVLTNTPTLLIAKPATMSGLNGEAGRLLLLEWSVQSAWGNYDVDVVSARVSVEGPEALVFEPAYVIQRTHEMNHQDEPYQGGWVLNSSASPPEDGRYTATLGVPNLQGTVVAESSVDFRIEGGRLASGPEQELPAPPAALLVLALFALALARRR